MDKTIVILGSTGSVGQQTVDVASALGVKVAALTGSRNVKQMEAQARCLKPRLCVMSDEKAAADLRVSLADTPVEVRAGREEVLAAASLADQQLENVDMIFNSIGQSYGLEPTLCALHTGKPLALANKESIVMAGEIVMRTARENGVQIIPVDSEHSAIFQCLESSDRRDLRSILLTASGGPFFGMTKDELREITPERALAHPTWKMGAKITIDSATLMNKGFEVIEAVHLFGVQPEQIEVVVHRESMIHSMVEYNDNAIIAQISRPDMRLCAQFAMTYPRRVEGIIDRLSLTDVGRLTFYKPDMENFPLLKIAYDCIRQGGVLPAALVMADEVAVSQFMDGFIGFCDIADVVEKTLSRFQNKENPTLDDIQEAGKTAMLEAAAICKSLH
ncbi:MAG: 1-deoxy-D-xylulose-5-phosphate reductoisomerase [Clostridia bacterium]|nr:1-deoxy-D-xylulose-5-phosphate reductoisomerase [Clostridia bacterium]